MKPNITPLTITEYRRTLADAGTDAEELVETVHNCLEAIVYANGEVWIEGPQAGHYLSDEEIRPLMAYEDIPIDEEG